MGDEQDCTATALVDFKRSLWSQSGGDKAATSRTQPHRPHQLHHSPFPTFNNLLKAYLTRARILSQTLNKSSVMAVAEPDAVAREISNTIISLQETISNVKRKISTDQQEFAFDPTQPVRTVPRNTVNGQLTNTSRLATSSTTATQQPSYR